MSIYRGKRISCFLLAVAMLFSLMPAAFSEEAAETGDPLAKEVAEEETIIQNAEPEKCPEYAAEAPYEETILPAETESVPEAADEQLPEIAEEPSSQQEEESLAQEEAPEEEEPASSAPEEDAEAEEVPAEELPEEQDESSESSEAEDGAEDSQETEADTEEPEEGAEEEVSPEEGTEEVEETEDPEETEEDTEEAEDPEENDALKMVTFFSSQEISLAVTGEAGEIGSVTPEEAAAYFASLKKAAESGDRPEAEEQALPETAELPAEDNGAGEEASEASEAAELPAEEGQNGFRAVYLLPAGVYTYSASAEGYFSQNGIPFEVSEDAEEYSITIELEENQLPYGFKGMPEGYVLSKDELAAKRALKEHGIAEQVARMTEGEDYAAGEVFFVTDSKEYARMVAEAYSAELKNYENGVAVLVLKTATVTEAIKAAADMNLCLPAVEPNAVRTMSPIYGEGRERRYYLQGSGKVPVLQSWEIWYNETGAENADEYLRDPTASDYQYMHDVVNTYEAWGVTKGAGVTVAVLDSGVCGHEDLPRMQALNATSGNEHATHVAGIIAAAEGNAIGGAGIAPEAGILSYCCTNDRGTVYTSQVIGGINAIIQNGNAWIMNCSFSGPIYSQAEYEYFEKAINAGITVVCSMGNNGTNIMNYPAAYSISGLIAVSSTTESGARSVFSNYGAWADVSAPGSAIMSTLPDGYGMMSGTSMAAPVVSGVCALYMSAYGYTSPTQMEKIIKSATTNGVVDASKLFVKDKTAPVFSCAELSGGTAPYGSTIEIKASDSAANGAAIVYTTDGKTPAVKDGKVTAGALYDPENGLEVTSENGFQAGKTVTVKAICVSGMGVAGNVATLRVKVAYCEAEEVVIRNAPAEEQSIVAGKSVTLQASVLPEGANPAVSWKIDKDNSSGCPGTHFDAKHPGVLVTGGNDSGTVTVIAQAANGITGTAQISIQKNIPVSTIRLTAGAEENPAEKYILNAECGAEVQLQSKAFAADGNPLSGIGFTWSSSNAAVASVTEDGKVTALRAGKATVTCTATDGSGVSASCEITSATLTISGKMIIRAGSSTLYTLKSNPTLSKNNIIWSISGHRDVSVSATGKVTVPKSVEPGTELTLTVTVNAGSAQAEVTLKTERELPNLIISGEEDIFGGAGATHDSRTGALKQATLYSVETDYWAGREKTWYDAQIQLKANDDSVTWASSKPDVANVTEDGLVKAHKAGTATITCTNENGKKATVSIKVINPASGVTVVSGSTATWADDYKVLGVGKTVTNKAVLGDAFGKPSVTRVNWSIEVLVDPVYDEDDGTLLFHDEDTENEILSKKLITVSTSGAVAAKSGILNYADLHTVYVFAVAATTDNTQLSGYVKYLVTPVQTGLVWNLYYRDVNADTEIGDFYSLGSSYKNAVTVNTAMNHILDFEIYAYETGYSGVWDFTVTSSNPKIAGGYIVRSNTGTFLRVITNNRYTGSAKITVKATDGSNKTAAVTVKVNKAPAGDKPVFPAVSYGTNTISVSAGARVISRFTAPCDGEFVFTTTGEQDTYGYLYDSGLSELARDDNSGDGYNFCIAYSLSAGEVVYVGVECKNLHFAGKVTLNINGSLNAKPVSVGPNSVAVFSSAAAFYRFTAPYTSTFTITTAGTDDTYGSLYDSGTTELTQDDNSGFDKNFKIVYSLSEGQTVYIGVKYSNSEASGSVALNISGVSAGLNSIPVAAGEETLRGFTVPFNGEFTFTAAGAEDTYGSLYDSGMNLLASDDSSGSGENFRITHTLSAEEVVYIGIRYTDPEDSGTVSLRISGVPSVLEAVTGVNSVPVYEDTVTWRRFTAPVEGTFIFTTTGPENTYGFLYDDEMDELAEDDNSGDGHNFSISYTLSEGQTVYIGVQFCSASTSGIVSLSISNAPIYRALTIGNTYSGTSITNLPGCERDARTMKELLESMSATPYTVTMQKDRTASQILSDISVAFAGATASDVSLFYYSGHGYSISGDLVGHDRTSLSFSKLRSALDRIPGKKIVILDSCYSGQAIGKDKTIMSVEVTEDSLQAYADAAINAFCGGTLDSGELAASDYYVITACSKGQTSNEIGDASISFGAFTLCFEYVCGWDEMADSKLDHLYADQNGDGEITLHEGYTAAKSELDELMDQFGVTQTSKVNPENSSFVLFGR